MALHSETDQETPIKTRVRIYTLTNRSERVGRIRRALCHTQGRDLYTEDINDLIMEAGCKKLEEELGLNTAA